MLERLFRKATPEVSGIAIAFLQKRLERFSNERLNAAMQRAWHRPYDEKTFFAVSIFGRDAATIKVGNVFLGILHYDHRITSKELGDVELPDWAIHNAYSQLECKCPGGIPKGATREEVYGFLTQFCAELASPETVAFFFTEERVLLPNNAAVASVFRSGKRLDPAVLA